MIEFEKEFDNTTGITYQVIYDSLTGETFLKKKQDVAPIIAENKAKFNSSPIKGQRFRRALTEVASIPTLVASQWMKEGVNIYDKNCQKEIARRLNSPEWRYLRTTPGILK